jgi:hypothetical protein
LLYQAYRLVGQIVAPLIIVIFFLFGGLFVNLEKVPEVFRWIQWISTISYSNKALNQNEFYGLTFNTTRPGQNVTFDSGVNIVEIQKLNNPPMWWCIVINAGLGLTFLLLGFIFFNKTSAPLLRLNTKPVPKKEMTQVEKYVALEVVDAVIDVVAETGRK